MQNHLKAVYIDGGKNFFPCEICDKEFYTQETYNKHYKNAHNKINNDKEYKYAVSNCQQTYTRVDALREHMKRAHQEGPRVRILCVSNTCSQTFLEPKYLKARVNLKHPCLKLPKRCESQQFTHQTLLGAHTDRNHNASKKHFVKVANIDLQLSCPKAETPLTRRKDYKPKKKGETDVVEEEKETGSGGGRKRCASSSPEPSHNYKEQNNKNQ